ncbi:Clp protease N-terminal domain-containing protein [Streptomyces caatingaensis]|uniref:Peptidase n=1 Tax=Streptomyces caatingaensis TaxID=1678637 RepID=A0A0K9XG50_9ACTN|nr:Clp protease N-terminal domain-containing protein [Streptomyces caatingaensis]KNB52188.1 peptidase [Streptomyces caatingaensis]
MHSRTPDPSAPGGRPLTAELTAAVAGARRRAQRDGDRQIDTAHLLHSLLEADADARRALPGGPPQVARLLGYLVQRSIGYGLRWSATVEDSQALPRPPAGGAPGWSPAAATAMAAAATRAGARGARRVHGTDLLAALAHDPRCRAVDVLRRAGVDLMALDARLHPEVRQARSG